MKLGHGNEIKFVNIIEGVTYFMVVLDGEDTMRIACDPTYEPHVIWVSTTDGKISTATKGRFETTAKLLEDAEGAPLGAEVRVDSASVYRYANPRLASLLGRLLRAAN